MDWFLISFVIIWFIVLILSLAVFVRRSIKKRQPPKDRIIKKPTPNKVIQPLLAKNIDGEYYVYNNIKFKYNNELVEIDYVVINRYGIFVINTKDVNGIVIGKNDSYNWHLKNDWSSQIMSNPVIQNRIQMEKLSRALDIDKSYFHNIVVFLKGADISHADSKYVCSAKNLKSKLTLEKECFTKEKILKIKEQFDNFYNQNNVLKEELTQSLLET